MATEPQVNFFKEKLMLNEEEKSLKEMLTKFQDQLNRLKIEELALLSHMKMQAERQKQEGQAASVTPSDLGAETSASDLGGTLPSASTSEQRPNSKTGSTVAFDAPVDLEISQLAGEDYEEEEELDLDVPQTYEGYQTSQRAAGEEEEEEDEEELDLDVPQAFNGYQGSQRFGEEEEEEYDSDSHLYSYMDTV